MSSEATGLSMPGLVAPRCPLLPLLVFPGQTVIVLGGVGRFIEQLSVAGQPVGVQVAGDGGEHRTAGLAGVGTVAVTGIPRPGR